MIEDKLKKVEEDSPNRCQSVTTHGQCTFERYGESLYCKMHGGGYGKDAIEAKKLRNYQFVKYQHRIGQFADNNQVKSLREEIGILRMIMEETINKCQDSNDLLIYSPKITDLTLRIEKLVSSCHRLETSLGHTMDKTAILNIATRIVNIISDHVSDEKVINIIVEKIGELITE